VDGCRRADSLTFNPHKWLFTPIDCSALYTRHREVFRRTFSLFPEYLTTPTGSSAEGAEDRRVDLMDYGLQLGRRFRALKLWWVLRAFGRQGICQRIRSHVRLAQEFATWIDEQPDFERLAPSPLSVVCFRAHPPGVDDPGELDRVNLALLERINSDGAVFLSHTRLDPGITLRVAIGNLGTTNEDMDRCRDLLKENLACLSPR
jgi:aromatic-L-amino-acid decarboxylase